MNQEMTARLSAWLEEASRHPAIAEPTAMTLATATPSGKPSARIVLLKALDARGFCFYTNMESRKGQEILANPQGALCFHWMPLHRQLRAEGAIEEVTPEEADAYFMSRPRESRIGAWASDQSRPLESRAALVARMQEAEARFAGAEATRPPYWTGYRLVPQLVEFWQEAPHRLHDRETYTRQGDAWVKGKLYP